MKGEEVWTGIAQTFGAMHGESGFEVAEGAPTYGSFGPEASWLALREAASDGLPLKMLDALKVCMQWSEAQLALFLRVSEKTLQRSRAAGKGLGIEAAEKVIDLARILGQGLDTFGSGDRLLAWLRTPALWFDDEPPEKFLSDDFGRRMVEEAIGRLEQGFWH